MGGAIRWRKFLAEGQSQPSDREIARAKQLEAARVSGCVLYPRSWMSCPCVCSDGMLTIISAASPGIS